MKKIVLLLATVMSFSQLCFAYPMPNSFPPFHIAGNLYYVGTDDLASYLVATPQGNILINSNFEPNVPMIKASIEKLGFKYTDTKILLISHAHNDHAAGSKLIKQQTNATYMVMDADVPLVETGGKSDFYYSNDSSFYFPPSMVDKVFHDGDQVQLGGSTLTAHLTPGHTKGCTTWTMQVTDHGKQYQAIIVGSLNVNTGYNLIKNTNYPTIAQDFKHSFAELKSLPGDIFLGAHAGYFDLQKKYTLLNKNETNPFIDPAGYKKHIAKKEQEFNFKFENQKRTISFVNKAKDYIQQYGKGKALAEFNKKSGEFNRDFSYIAAVDYNGTFLASLNYPDLVGTNQISFKDPTGVYIVQEEIATAKSGGGWSKSRLRKNPQTGKYECKELYILPMVGDYFITSGYYYPADDQGNCY